MGNYVIGVGNYVIATPSELGNYKIADTFHATSVMSLRVAHQEAPVPSVRAARPSALPELDALVAAMLAKDPAARPSALAVYQALLPLVTGSVATAEGPLPGGNEGRDPVRPLRQPLLGVAGYAVPAAPFDGTDTTHNEIPLSEAEADQLRADVLPLLNDDHPSEAILLLEQGLARAAPGSFPELRMRHLLAAALLVAGQNGQAARFFEQAGAAYRKYLGPSDPLALDCAYQAGHAYAQVGKPDKALPQLRYYVVNGASLAADDADEAGKVLDSRFVIAQLLATTGDFESAIAELRDIRPMLAAAYGLESPQVHNLNKQIDRFSERTSRSR
jgi:tetratricopeptide (TPR) repeat protein